MMKNWDIKKLRDLADIRVSNVDKKIYPSERPVKLCNYMDVYANDYITGSIQFMKGSANDAELERFGLNIGDVIITKDSETPDDIGIPTVIYEQIDNLVCGYHLALIRPDNEKIDSIFLSKYLSTSRVANYFALHASGSTRFGLPIGAIESVEILTPPKEEQKQIATVLSTIDRAIAQTEAIIAKQQRIKTGLMQELLTKGIDENGNIRSETTHEFKDSAIGRIPVEWEVKELREVSLIIDPNPSHRYPPSSDIGVPIASTENFVGDNDFDLSVSEKVPFYVFEQQNQRCNFSQTDVVFARKGRLGFARYYGESEKVFSHTVVIFKKRDEQLLESHYLLWLVRFRDFFDQLDKRMNSNSGVPTLGVQFLGSVPVRIPKLSEQIQICSTLDSLEMRIEEEKRSLSKQKRQKTGLMQGLLTGKVRVTSLNKE
ncbi:restriction endonuclease subunit S [Kamptonema sp. UHCC 0994]|uniref:restriction endonuclease subunit S n=1 Tax=Kamptonema sp. UHCC 0994 TaxID=3031329 RepID=UPI0023BAB473|nr:restriction endonuclease subunit S [Kamptonema sp. UHCC 0994]MDF0556465.1 restriction endonuclease subunit S [Kamptonema sp. UHCC 0994]